MKNRNKLGAVKTSPQTGIEAIPVPDSARIGRLNGSGEFVVESATEEFTCLCPKTGQPDYAKLRIFYIPQEQMYELKSLKLYLWKFREEGHFHEDVTNMIANKLFEALRPRALYVLIKFNTRGGIWTNVRAFRGSKTISDWAHLVGGFGRE